MSWHPNDLLTDADLLAYERTLLTQFGVTDWIDRRTKALEDWLWPIVEGQGLDRHRFRTRYAPDLVYGYTGSAYTDYTSATTSTTTGDLPLATVWATPASDALYVGSTQPFRGLSWRVGTANATAAVVTVTLSCDEWRTVSVEDGTVSVAGKTLSRGGPMIWRVPDGWVLTPVNSQSYYWAQVTVSATPAGATASQVGVIRRSRLCGPVTFRTLALVFREAPTGQDGPWRDKAEWYEAEAAAALQRALPLIGGEFDTGTEDDQIDATEAVQTTEEASDSSGWGLERA